MQAVTALAHLNACILFLMDISETCGYTIDQQISLFNNIKPLFQAKPLVIVLTKIDLCKYTELEKKQREQIEALAKETNAYMIQMSNESGDGITDVKARACDILIDHRLTLKAKDPKKAEAIMAKLHIAQPKKRDNIVREAFIPKTVIDGVKKQGPTIKELQEEYGGAGKFYIPEEEHYLLENEDWRYDKWPEFYLGKNVADFYDKEIEEKLQKLEEEEEKILQMEKEQAEAAESSSDEDGITRDDLEGAVKTVRGKIKVIRMDRDMNKNRRAKSKLKNAAEMAEQLKAKGIDLNEESFAARAKTRKTLGDLEAAHDARVKAALGEDSSDDGDDSVMSDEDMKATEGKQRGRKRTRDDESDEEMNDGKVRLGKRRRTADADIASDSSDDEEGKKMPKGVRGSLSKRNMRLTPEQRKLSYQKNLRDRSASRREGTSPARLGYKPVPEEHVRLAKKINAAFKHKI